MRLWLSESERRPDPAPARADARKALLAGTVLWALALVASLIFAGALASAGLGWVGVTCWVGVALGLAGLVVVQVSRRRRRQSTDASGSAPTSD
ncbi:DUF2530 domain-containing protein [Agromyces larvae]|uniref:DUF2530 domain-containing protein n=1 Tax=Agromyces larvae TaxID=2929802 RepID=A0ABY4C3G6_9MICO|nr:DUF2530 domain-containing protein [Agromyces larvae]UOE45859.1 DUF2530 domain-containing protein [Agromyces larvae]